MIPELSFPWGWQHRAACDGLPTDWWYPDKGVASQHAYTRARAVCKGCPVRTDCLRDAIYHETQHADRHGMRGGMTPDQRRNLATLFPHWRKAA